MFWPFFCCLFWTFFWAGVWGGPSFLRVFFSEPFIKRGGGGPFVLGPSLSLYFQLKTGSQPKPPKKTIKQGSEKTPPPPHKKCPRKRPPPLQEKRLPGAFFWGALFGLLFGVPFWPFFFWGGPFFGPFWPALGAFVFCPFFIT